MERRVVIPKKVVLVSAEGDRFEVDDKIANFSSTLRSLFDLSVPDVAFGDEDNGIAIPLPNIASKTLAKLVQFCEHHKTDPPVNEQIVTAEAIAERRTNGIPFWDAEFLAVDKEFLFEIMTAANYLDMKLLLSYCAMSVANMIHGKTIAELRALFGIENDLTPEEDAAIREETLWLDSK